MHSGNAFSDFSAISAVGSAAASGGDTDIKDKVEEEDKNDEGTIGSANTIVDQGLPAADDSKFTSATSAVHGDKEKKLNDRSDRGERAKHRSAALIISFPPNYPATGFPTFTLRSGGLASSSSSLRSDIIAELASIAKGATLNITIADDQEVRETLTASKLLFDVAECFRCRTLQYWGVRINIPITKGANSKTNTTLMSSQTSFASGGSSVVNGHGQSGTSPSRPSRTGSFGDIGLDLDGSSDMTPPLPGSDISLPVEVGKEHLRPSELGESPPRSMNLSVESEQRQRISGDVMYDGFDGDKPNSVGDDTEGKALENAPYSKATEVIDPHAYYVPCPASSGAIFSPSGMLLTFGGAKIVIKKYGGELPLDDSASKPTEAESNELNLDSSINADLSGVRGAQNLFPKSYADMLLRQREREFYESEKSTVDPPVQDTDIKSAANVRLAGSNPAVGYSSPRHLIKSSSGVFFVDQNLNSDTSTVGGDTSSNESVTSGSEDSPSSDEDDSGDEKVKEKKDQIIDSSILSQAVYANPLLLGDMDMEALSAHLDEEQNFAKSTSGTNFRSSTTEFFDAPGSVQKRKRVAMLDALEVQHPTVVEIYAGVSSVDQRLADMYDLGPLSMTKAPSQEQDSRNLKKTVNALFAHLRVEKEARKNKRIPGSGYITSSFLRSPSRGIEPQSRAKPPHHSDADNIFSRIRTTSSYNDLLIAEADHLYEESHSKSVDKDSAFLDDIFPVDFTDAAGNVIDALTWQANNSRKGVTWSREFTEDDKFRNQLANWKEDPSGKLSETSPKKSNGGESGHKRVSSSTLNSIRQLPFSMADLEDAVEKGADTGDVFTYDEYEVDDFPISVSGGIRDNQQEIISETRHALMGPSNNNACPDSESSGDNIAEQIIRDYTLSKILARIHSCKYNADTAASNGDDDAHQLWNFVCISLETMANSIPVHPNELALLSESKYHSKLLSSRNPQTSWTDSAIGLLLLRRVLNLCEQTGSVQTMATILCVLGGASHVAVLLAGRHPYFDSCSLSSLGVPIVQNSDLLKLEVHFNSILNAYYNILYCWRKFVVCTEVEFHPFVLIFSFNLVCV